MRSEKILITIFILFVITGTGLYYFQTPNHDLRYEILQVEVIEAENPLVKEAQSLMEEMKSIKREIEHMYGKDSQEYQQAVISYEMTETYVDQIMRDRNTTLVITSKIKNLNNKGVTIKDLQTMTIIENTVIDTRIIKSMEILGQKEYTFKTVIEGNPEINHIIDSNNFLEVEIKIKGTIGGFRKNGIRLSADYNLAQ
ncbi:hypothetical protein GF326_01430 [Candidatus Bathyarchaeota archaeon]|nr:hypothetical protein [Candidatus Bathyarchaeota archaeon]